MTPVHGYFADKARTVFAAAGGNPDNAGPLATWAAQVRAGNDSRLGVVVAETGAILAGTRHVPSTISSPGATYVRSVEHDEDASLVGRELGLTLGALRRRHGSAIHVRFSEVCTGRGLR